MLQLQLSKLFAVTPKFFQDLGQAHASILNGDPNIILGHHAGQSQVTVSAAGGQQIPVSQIIATQSGQTHGKHYILIDLLKFL